MAGILWQVVNVALNIIHESKSISVVWDLSAFIPTAVYGNISNYGGPNIPPSTNKADVGNVILFYFLF